MKHFKIITFVLLYAVSVKAQVVDKGWYFFKNPMSHIYGVGFNKPKANTDLKYVGSTDITVNATDLIVLDGPDESYYVDKGWSDLVLASVFNRLAKVYHSNF